MSLRPLTRAALLCVTLACTIERASPPDSSAATADGAPAAREVAAGEVTSDTIATPAADTLVRDAIPQPGGAADTVVAAGAADASGALPVATSSELDALRATLVIPVQGVRAADLRDTWAETRGGGRTHEAIDILAPRGTPVIAATDGRLLKLHESVPGGHMVYASDASERFILMYGHLDRYADGLVEGMRLGRGQVIGYVGTSGNAPPGTPHLHLAIVRGEPRVAWWRGTPVNPYALLAR